MKIKFLTTTAMVVIGLSGAAWAQQTTPTGKPDPAAETTTQDLMLKRADTSGTENPAAATDPAA